MPSRWRRRLDNASNFGFAAAILKRRALTVRAKDAKEMGQRCKAGFIGDFRDRRGGTGEQRAGVAQAALREVFGKTASNHAVKGRAEVAHGQAAGLRGVA